MPDRPERARPVRSLVKRLVVAAALVAGAAVPLVLGTQGCATVPARPPEPCDVQLVTLNVYAADNINPNENGNPRPVVLRVYQLKNDQKLLNARYDDVLRREAQVLGSDVTRRDEVEIFPNDLVELKFERDKEAAYLAGVALFHTPRGVSWKTFYEFPLSPGKLKCARDPDAGVVAEPKVTFFLEDTKLDNGSQYDESMFPNARPIRQINLPKKSAAPEQPPPPPVAAPPPAGAK